MGDMKPSNGLRTIHSPALDTPTVPIEPLLNISDVALICGKSKRTILRWVREGKLPSFKIGGSRFFNKQEIWDFLRARPSTTPPTTEGMPR